MSQLGHGVNALISFNYQKIFYDKKDDFCGFLIGIGSVKTWGGF